MLCQISPETSRETAETLRQILFSRNDRKHPGVRQQRWRMTESGSSPVLISRRDSVRELFHLRTESLELAFAWPSQSQTVSTPVFTEQNECCFHSSATGAETHHHVGAARFLTATYFSGNHLLAVRTLTIFGHHAMDCI